MVIAALGVVGVLVTAGWLMLSGRRASPTPESRLAARDKAESRSAQAPLASARQPGRLSILFERPPRSAVARVWVDRKAVSEQRWADAREAKTRLLRFGSHGADALRLEPGGHDVEVEVVWAGKRSKERIWGDVKPSATRRLRAKLGGLLKKKLSLEWE